MSQYQSLLLKRKGALGETNKVFVLFCFFNRCCWGWPPVQVAAPVHLPPPSQRAATAGQEDVAEEHTGAHTHLAVPAAGIGRLGWPRWHSGGCTRLQSWVYRGSFVCIKLKIVAISPDSSPLLVYRRLNQTYVSIKDSQAASLWYGSTKNKRQQVHTLLSWTLQGKITKRHYVATHINAGLYTLQSQYQTW